MNTIHESKNYGKFKVIEYIDAKNVIIEFLSTGYKTTVQVGKIKTGSVKDKLMPTVHGVGYMGDGDYKASINGKNTKPYKVWIGMLERCYDTKCHKRCPTYAGCTVASEWHNFQNFTAWFDENYIDGCELDKDIKVKGNKVYSPDTCVFVSQADNVIEASAKYYKFISPAGKVVDIYNLSGFCRDSGLGRANMSSVNSGKIKSHKGWKKW